ncbi:hypothetical protein JKF63_01700 [Porcisia hertigi]|uniref:EF-hand domain-containing protein n=1 Tax=Porcisia hertigi TaxID=2761500 RepID=A0A836LB29_9TRYP|nr:hypothetical protein JKF63_01700 [Porcisia hertigi]
MDPLGSPLAPSANVSSRASLLLPSKPASATSVLPRIKSQRCVKFDPIVDDDANDPAHSGGPSLETSFAQHTGGDADSREQHGRGGVSDASLLGSPLYSNKNMHDHGDSAPFELTRDDVVAAFEFLDMNRSGLLTMGNLKHRLSAFFPHMTSKEYKFLVEDPNSTTHGSGAPSSAAKAAQGTQHGGATEGVGGNTEGLSPASVTLSGSPARPTNASFGGGEAIPKKGIFSGEGCSGGPGGLCSSGTRVGLDVDQLWDLINSFQQLQRSLGSGQVNAADGHDHNSRAAFNASIDTYLVGPQGGDSSPSVRGCFDAVGEAFRVYDPRNSHYVEEDILSCIMARVGFGDLSEEELAVLVSTADFDGDGRISLEDFRRLVNMKGRFKK